VVIKQIGQCMYGYSTTNCLLVLFWEVLHTTSGGGIIKKVSKSSGARESFCILDVLKQKVS
jgi:hypothetical protein